jgi:hypothetical protein
MKLFLRTLLGDRFEIDGVLPSHSISELKILMYALHGFVPSETRIIYAGKDIYEGLTVGEFNMRDQGTLYIVFRLRP